MGADISGPKLVAAVANAGGVGLLASPVNMYDATLKAIRDTKKLTDKPFGAGILLEFDQTHTVRAIFEEKLACMQVFWETIPKRWWMKHIKMESRSCTRLVQLRTQKKQLLQVLIVSSHRGRSRRTCHWECMYKTLAFPDG
ncbi:hypothetical protein MKW92_021585 [Papaver armeniacum]|nr:hypothetical protein MKW92_021585 [Papaver armeniacum]